MNFVSKARNFVSKARNFALKMMNFAASSVQSVDDLARAAVSTMGSSAAFLPAPISGHECRRVAVPNAYSQAWRLGRTVLEAQLAQTDPVAAVVRAENGRVVFVGKVVDVTRTAADRCDFSRRILIFD